MPHTLKHSVVEQHATETPPPSQHHPLAFAGILVLFLGVVIGLLWAGRLRRRALEQQTSQQGKRQKKRNSRQSERKS